MRFIYVDVALVIVWIVFVSVWIVMAMFSKWKGR